VFSLYQLVELFFWIFQPFAMSGIVHVPYIMSFYLEAYAVVPFLGSYLVILFIWMEVYHGKRDRPVKLYRYYIFIMLILIFTQIGLFLYDIFTIDKKQLIPRGGFLSDRASLPQMVWLFLSSGVYFLISLLYCLYGIRIYCRFSQFKSGVIASKLENILPRLKLTTAFIWIFFTLRFLIVTLADIANWNITWWSNFLFYFFLDLLPILVLLYTFVFHNFNNMHNPSDMKLNSSIMKPNGISR